MPPTGLDKLKHIVVLMMENRSFDHMLGALKAIDPRIDGVDGTSVESRHDGRPRAGGSRSPSFRVSSIPIPTIIFQASICRCSTAIRRRSGSRRCRDS